MSLSSFLGIQPPLPRQPDPDDTILWLRAQIAESEAFLQSQPGYSDIDRAIKAITSQDDTKSGNPAMRASQGLSQTRTNRIGKIAEDLAAMLTDTKPFWDYQVANRRFEKHAEIYGKLATFWYQNRSVDMVIAELAKYYTACGTAYLYKYYDPEEQDICCRSLDPRHVLPIRPKDYTSLETCRGVVIKELVPVSYIKDRYGIDVPPDADGSALSLKTQGDPTSDGDIRSPIHKWAKRSKSEEKPKIPCVWLYTCFLKDPRKNESGKPKEMGQWMEDPNGQIEPDSSDPTQFRIRRIPANNWSYLVQPNEPLFPNRRMIMWVGNHTLYDGPSYYWHGRFPVIKFTLQPYPWSWFGKAPVWDLLKLQDSLNRLLRVIDDHAEQVAQPGSIHDKNSVSSSEFQQFDTRRAGWKIRQNPLAGKGIQIIDPKPLDPGIWDQIKWIIEEMDTLAGTRDLSQLTRLNQLPSNETIESIIASMTPGLRLRSRILEAFMRELATQLAYDFTQFYTVAMRCTILGPGGITQDDFDYDPGSLMPDFISDNDYSPDGSISPAALLRGPSPRFDRAKEFLRRLTFKVVPGSLLNSAQMEQKLIYLQLARAGWMDIFTLWEVLGIPNIGVLPDNVHTIPERLAYQALLGLNGQVNAAGRKATGQDVPRVVTKES